MSRARWNFRLGPLQFTAPVTTSAVIGLAVVVLCCCGPGLVMTLMEDSPDSPVPSPSVVVETSAPAATPVRTRTPVAPEVVTAGAFCDRAGDKGVTKAGTPMVCKGSGDLRWRRP